MTNIKGYIGFCFTLLFLAMVSGCLGDKGSEKSSTVTFIVDVPEGTPKSANVYISGDFEGWTGGGSQNADYLASLREDGKYELSLTKSVGTVISFKFTQGDWASVEKTKDGAETENRTFTFSQDDVSEEIEIAHWVVINSREDLEREVANLLKQFDAPSLAFTLVDIHGESWNHVEGKADIANDIKADENTLYRVGSISKMFVAIASMQLVEQGKLSLDVPIKSIIPEIEFSNQWKDTHPITLAHLLEHTTGWDDLHFVEYAHNEEPAISLKDGLDFHPKSRTSRWVPGTRYSYSNSGSAVAAYIVQKVSGMPFEEYVYKNIFTPIGMHSSTYLKNEDVQTRGITAYSGGDAQPYWNIIMRPAGAINASMIDMQNYLKFLLDHGKSSENSLLSESSFERMERPLTSLAAKQGIKSGYGLANYDNFYNGFSFRGHDGGMPGAIASLGYLPEHGRGYAIALNSDNMQLMMSLQNILRSYLLRDLNQTAIEMAVQGNNGGFEGMEGYYQISSPRSEIGRFLMDTLTMQRVNVQDGNIQVSSPFNGGAFQEYVVVGGDVASAVSTQEPALAVVDDPLDGKSLQLSMMSFRKISSIEYWARILGGVFWILGSVTALLFALVWVSRYFLGQIKEKGAISVRLWPFISTAAALGFILVNIFRGVSGNILEAYGNLTFVSLMTFILSIVFAVTAVYGVVNLIRLKSNGINAIAYWHSALVAFLHTGMAFYLLSYGLIGIRTWA